MIVASARRDDDVVKMLDAMVTRKMEMEMAEINGGREKAKWREEIVANDWRRQNWREGEWRTFGEPIGDNVGSGKSGGRRLVSTQPGILIYSGNSDGSTTLSTCNGRRR